MARQGNVGSDITLKYNFYVNGNLFDPFQVNDIDIYDGGFVIDTITPTRTSLGTYQIVYSIPDSLAVGTYYDKLSWVAESGMVTKTQLYGFEVVAASTSTTDPDAISQTVACRITVSWIHRIGLVRTEDMGNGMGVALFWQDAASTSANTTVHYNVYYADNRLDVLDSFPVAITKEKFAILNVPPGNEQFFTIRATEFDVDEYDIAELVQIGEGLHQYPEEQILLNNINDAYGATIEVEDNSEYPNKGYLLIGTEVFQYSTKGTNAFTITDTQRGYFESQISSHTVGDIVRLFKGIEEGNSVIHSGTAAWHQVNPRNVDAIGEFNVAEDGYRENKVDIVTTDLSGAEENAADFPTFDFCGYHRPSPQDTFSGKCVGSYVGGENNGFRGLSIQDQSQARLEVLLQLTGTPCVLLRRKQTGRRCRCGSSDLRREHPNARCQYCYGTGFEGGYDRIFNTRAISELFVNTIGAINARIAPFVDDLKLESSNGLIQPVELSAWTLAVPIIKDRDVIVTFLENFTEEFRYECLDVTRNRLFFNQIGQQQFRVKRQDKTDIMYTYNINDATRFVRI